MDDDQLISISEIADIHGKRRQSLHNLARRLGFNIVKQKSDRGRGQRINHITVSDYEKLKQHFGSWEAREYVEAGDGFGVFYIVQLEPELDPGRVKVGYTENLDERLRSHRTSAPFSVIVETWPCKPLWEKTAIDCVTQDCENLYTEVFRAANVDELIEKADDFFGLMPTVTTDIVDERSTGIENAVGKPSSSNAQVGA